MNRQDDSDFINYYEILGVAENATTSEIEGALRTYQSSMEAQLNNPLTMHSARDAINTIIPGIQQNLLSGIEARRLYDKKLAEHQRKENQRDGVDEPPENEGLDVRIRQPFFFDLYNGFDTEPATYTLRGIARRLDEEWQQAQAWITDTSSPIHPIVGYLSHAALRPRLATRVGQIIQQVTGEHGPRMDVNEGIERCIMLFNPNVVRPMVAIESPDFDGKTLESGSFLPDRPAQSEFVLYHKGGRGCAFGTLESHTPWMTFYGGASTQRFALLPEGNDPAEMKVQLYFQVDHLPRGVEHTAKLAICLENWDPPRQMICPVIIHVLVLPPRVWFEPIATEKKPLQVRPVRRGELISVTITPRNGGDEAHIPLVAQIHSTDPAADAVPARFQANQPITLQIDTSNRPFGKTYDVVYKVDYQVPGAEGPATVCVQGEVLPTLWQSMLQTKALGNRLLQALLVGGAGFLLLGGMGNFLALSLQSSWFLFLIIPLLFLWFMHIGTTSIVRHIQQAGKPDMEKHKVSPYLLWAFPLGLGLVLALICALVHNGGLAFDLGGIVGACVGLALGFVMEGASSGVESPGQA